MSGHEIAPVNGVTVAAHIAVLLQRTDEALNEAFLRIEQPKRLSVAERDSLRQQLAGVIANCETIRVWLAAGAPR